MAVGSSKERQAYTTPNNGNIYPTWPRILSRSIYWNNHRICVCLITRYFVSLILPELTESHKSLRSFQVRVRTIYFATTSSAVSIILLLFEGTHAQGRSSDVRLHANRLHALLLKTGLGILDF